MTYGHDDGELVGDEENGDAVVADQGLQACQQRLHFRRRERGGGLVQDQDLCAAVESLEDLYPLPLAFGQLPYPGAEGDRETIPVAQRLHLKARTAEVQKASRAGVSEHDVLQHRVGGHESPGLVDHADPPSEGVVGGTEADALLPKVQGAFVCLQQTEKDVNKSGYAGSVLAQYLMSLSCLHLECHYVEGEHAGETLRDAPGREDGFRGS